jgi:hypothetical protein
MFKKLVASGFLGLILLACVGITYAAVTQTFVSSKGEKSTYTFVLEGDADTSDVQDISGSSWIGISSKGITADTINVQLSPHPAPPAAGDWFTLTDNVGVNPFAATNNFWQQSIVGARAIRFVRSGAADGDITITITLKK